MKQMIKVIATFMLTASVAHAAHLWDNPGEWWNKTSSYGDPPKFNANELSLDLFGSYINPESKFEDLFESNIRRGAWGGGAGVNYFFLDMLGIGGDFNVSDKSAGRLVDYAMGNIYFRVPIESIGLAPYIYGGGGRGISPIYEWLYEGGVGLEFRFNPHLGIFSDARYIWADRTFDRLLIRAGIRFAL